MGLGERLKHGKQFIAAHLTVGRFIELMSAIAMAFLINYLWAMIEYKLPIIGSVDNPFNGYWIAEFHSINVPDTTSIELLKIRQSGNDVVVYIENFNNKRPRVIYPLRGSGHIQGQNISINYYYENAAFPEVGALILHLEGTADGSNLQLIGQWVQSMNRFGKEASVVPQSYQAAKCKINLWRQIRNTFFGSNYFANFDEIASYVKAGSCDP